MLALRLKGKSELENAAHYAAVVSLVHQLYCLCYFKKP